MACYEQQNDRYCVKPIITYGFYYSKLFLWAVLIVYLAKGPCPISTCPPEICNTSNVSVKIPKVIGLASTIGEIIVGLFALNVMIMCFGTFFSIYDRCKGKPKDDVCSGCTESKADRLQRELIPVYFFDILFILTVAPVSNVYLFFAASLTGCPDAYVVILIRIAFYCFALSVPFIIAQLRLKKDDFPYFRFAVTLISYGMKLSTISSSLATFFKVGFPEQKAAVQYSYLVFTVMVGLTALLTGYVTLLQMVKFCYNKIDRLKRPFEYVGHASFVTTNIASIGLITLNSYILSSSESTEESQKLAKTALIFTSFTFVISFRHFLGSEFCGHGPLGKYLLLKCLRKATCNCCGFREKLEKLSKKDEEEPPNEADTDKYTLLKDGDK